MQPQPVDSTLLHKVVDAARDWLLQQGWEGIAHPENRQYTVAVSEAQTSGRGFCSVDVECTAYTPLPEDSYSEMKEGEARAADDAPEGLQTAAVADAAAARTARLAKLGKTESAVNDPAELRRRSRVLEISVPGGRVDAVLAGRDMAALQRILQVEQARLQSEQAASDRVREQQQRDLATAMDERLAAAADAAAQERSDREAIRGQEWERERDEQREQAAAEAAQRQADDEAFEREVEAEIARALADPEAYAAEQAELEAAAAAELAQALGAVC